MGPSAFPYFYSREFTKLHSSLAFLPLLDVVPGWLMALGDSAVMDINRAGFFLCVCIAWGLIYPGSY